MSATSERFDAYNVVEEKDGKARWIKVGMALVNSDGSINVFLDVFPTRGKVQLRPWREQARTTARKGAA